jgi:hypothetical protein
MKLSDLSETLIGSEIVKLGGEIREKIRQGQRIYNFTVGDFDPEIFPIPKELENEIVDPTRFWLLQGVGRSSMQCFGQYATKGIRSFTLCLHGITIITRTL